MRRGRKMLAFIVLLGVLSGLFCGCGDGSEASTGSQHGMARQINEIKDSGYIKIGVFRDNKPFGYLDDNGEYQGYDVYFARKIGEDLGIKVQFVPVDADNRGEVLDTGEVDLVLANDSATQDLSKVCDFAMPYIETSLGIVSNTQDTVKEINGLTDKLLIVVKGTAAEQYFKENYPEIKLLRVTTYDEAFDSLVKGLGDAFCSDRLQLLAWQKEHDGFEVGMEITGSKEQYAPAVQKDNEELMDWLNNEITALEKDEFFVRGYEETLKPILGNTLQENEIIIE